MTQEKKYDARTPYQMPFPKEALNEIVVPDAIPEDDRLWVPQAENVWSGDERDSVWLLPPTGSSSTHVRENRLIERAAQPG